MPADAGLRERLSRLLHRLANAAGLEIRLVRNVRAAIMRDRLNREIDAWTVLRHRPFACILDIGANEGQFASIARLLWPTAQIHSFEPLPDVHALLAAKFVMTRSCLRTKSG